MSAARKKYCYYIEKMIETRNSQEDATIQL